MMRHAEFPVVIVDEEARVPLEDGRVKSGEKAPGKVPNGREKSKSNDSRKMFSKILTSYLNSFHKGFNSAMWMISENWKKYFDAWTFKKYI